LIVISALGVMLTAGKHLAGRDGVADLFQPFADGRLHDRLA
jgi:hypothetical protein